MSKKGENQTETATAGSRSTPDERSTGSARQYLYRMPEQPSVHLCDVIGLADPPPATDPELAKIAEAARHLAGVVYVAKRHKKVLDKTMIPGRHDAEADAVIANFYRDSTGTHWRDKYRMDYRTVVDKLQPLVVDWLRNELNYHGDYLTEMWVHLRKPPILAELHEAAKAYVARMEKLPKKMHRNCYLHELRSSRQSRDKQAFAEVTNSNLRFFAGHPDRIEFFKSLKISKTAAARSIDELFTMMLAAINDFRIFVTRNPRIVWRYPLIMAGALRDLQLPIKCTDLDMFYAFIVGVGSSEAQGLFERFINIAWQVLIVAGIWTMTQPHSLLTVLVDIAEWAIPANQNYWRIRQNEMIQLAGMFRSDGSFSHQSADYSRLVGDAALGLVLVFVATAAYRNWRAGIRSQRAADAGSNDPPASPSAAPPTATSVRRKKPSTPGSATRSRRGPRPARRHLSAPAQDQVMQKAVGAKGTVQPQDEVVGHGKPNAERRGTVIAMKGTDDPGTGSGPPDPSGRPAKHSQSQPDDWALAGPKERHPPAPPRERPSSASQPQQDEAARLCEPMTPASLSQAIDDYCGATRYQQRLREAAEAFEKALLGQPGMTKSLSAHIFGIRPLIEDYATYQTVLVALVEGPKSGRRMVCLTNYSSVLNPIQLKLLDDLGIQMIHKSEISEKILGEIAHKLPGKWHAEEMFTAWLLQENLNLTKNQLTRLSNIELKHMINKLQRLPPGPTKVIRIGVTNRGLKEVNTEIMTTYVCKGCRSVMNKAGISIDQVEH